MSATRLSTPFPQEAGNLHHMLLVTVRDNTFRIAVVKAGSVLPPDIVSPEDNSRLFNLQHRFFSDKEIAFEALKEKDYGYEVVLEVNNPSDQDLLAFFEWELPNARWTVDPSKGRRVSLPAGTKEYPITFLLRRSISHPPEAFPTCIARLLYLTAAGDVVHFEHTFEIVESEDADQQ